MAALSCWHRCSSAAVLQHPSSHLSMILQEQQTRDMWLQLTGDLQAGGFPHATSPRNRSPRKGLLQKTAISKIAK